MSDSIRVWQPRSKQFQTGSFCVPNPSGEEVIARSQYEMMLESRIRELVEEDPEQARRLLTDLPEHNPDLYGIGMGSRPRDYPSQILICDQMQMLLNQIDWKSAGQNRLLEKSDLPSLWEIIESIPS